MKHATALLSTLGLSSIVASGAVNYVFDANSNDYVSGNSAISGTQSTVDAGLGTSGANDLKELIAFSTSDLGFGGSTPYTFGGFSAISDTDTEPFGGAMAFILRNDDPDVLRYQNTAGGEKQFDGVAMWNVTTSFAFNELSLEFTNSGGSGTWAQHLVVRAGGNYYVSTGSLTTPDQTLSLATTDTTWQLWDFTANSGDNYGVAFDSAVGPGALAVDAIGVYGTGSAPDGTNLQINVAQLGLVPEPSTYAAIAGLAVLGLALIRRRRRS